MSDRQARVILALDFDGVLHPVTAYQSDLFFCLPLLEGWLRKHDQVDVIVASAWREGRALHELASRFAPDLRHRVVGATPFFDRLYDLDGPRTAELLATARCKRQTEVEAWLAKERPGARWLALDDDPDNYQPGCRSLVVCDSSTGLTIERLEELSSVLRGSDARRIEPGLDRGGTAQVLHGWRVMRTPSGELHAVGAPDSSGMRGGLASSALASLNARTGRAVTLSGRVYLLVGHRAGEGARNAWLRHCYLHGIDEWQDVSGAIERQMRAARYAPRLKQRSAQARRRRGIWS